MKILVIDGQGGNIGKRLVKMISDELPDAELIAVGTNSIATANMMRGGAKNVATGENAVIVNARKADVIVGPLGVVIADSLLGEVTDEMALAVSKSDAVRVLIPLNKCENLVAGIDDISATALLEDAMKKIKQSCQTSL